MRKDITPDMYNYNKYPGPQFVSFDQVVKSDDLVLTLVENTGETFDAVAFTQRFSEILLKYDYIVGDWGNEQLRLRGFYKDERPGKPSKDKIGHLSDYLKEYCNFGCAYFILENPEPRELSFEEEELPSRRRDRRRRGGDRNRDRRRKDSPKERKASGQEQATTKEIFKKRSKSRPKPAAAERDPHGKQGHFTIRQKDRS